MSKVAVCRLCGGTDFFRVATLAQMPLSHYLRTSLDQPDPHFDIVFDCCERCGLTCIAEPIAAEALYRDTDTYLTGFQKPRHLDDLITTALACADPGRAIDIGCNDGSLMEKLKSSGYTSVVGIEPNLAAATAARNSGHTVYSDFLSTTLAERIIAEHGPFDAVYLRHVIEHVDNLQEFFAALRRLLQEDGLLIMEIPDVYAGFSRGNPSILWEEHVSYFTGPLAIYLLNLFGFDVLEKRSYIFGGGSLAFVARKRPLPLPPLEPPPADEAIRLAREFSASLQSYREKLRQAILAACDAGYAVVMYGAAPRSCVIAAACDIASSLDIVIDDRSAIQGRFMPGTERRIRGVDDATSNFDRPILCLLGVGAENEYKIRAKLAPLIDRRSLYISLFPPRDSLASVVAVLSQLASPA